MPNDNRSFTMRNELSELENLTREITEFGSRHAFSHKVVFQLNLALEEIVTNIISYGFVDDEEHRINVDLKLAGAELEARVEDDGIPYDPLTTPAPNTDAPLDERRVGGLGVHLIRELMDDVTYTRTGDKNVLTLSKRLDTPGLS